MTPYYQDDLVTLYHGDCREILPLLGESPDVLLTDPPYPGYDKGWEDVTTEQVADVLRLIPWRTAVVFWPALTPSPLPYHTAEDIWHKPNGRSAHHYERILIAGDADRRCRVHRTAAILPNYTQYAAESVDHPTQKPVKLVRQLLRQHPGRLVLDPFSGSGTTLRAAKDERRRAIGIEISETYCEITAQRLAQDVLDFGEAS